MPPPKKVKKNNLMPPELKKIKALNPEVIIKSGTDGWEIIDPS